MRRLVLVGLGLDPERHATVEALSALAEADLAFEEGLPPKIRAFLRRRTARLRTAPRSAQACLRAAAAADTVIFVTPGHPLLGSPLACLFASRARGRGIDVSALGSVSPLGAALVAAEQEFGGGVSALQALDAAAVLEGRARPEPSAVTLVYGLDSLGRRGAVRLKAFLSRLAPARRARRLRGGFWLLPPAKAAGALEAAPTLVGERASAPPWVEG